MSTTTYFVLLCSVAALTTSCQKELESSSSGNRFLYVSSGLCYSGSGVTTFTAATSSNQVFKVNTVSGKREAIIADYFASPASSGDTPVSIVDWDANNLLVLVRNVNAGRLETLPKLGGIRNNFGTTPAIGSIIASAPKSMHKSSDGGVLMTRTGFAEKINASGVRGTTPYINSNLGATCGTTNTLYTDMTVSATGRIITANAAASPNNRVISVPAAGATGTCSAGIAAPAATTYATAVEFDKVNGKLIVAYAGATTAAQINSIHAYDFDETMGAITDDQLIYDAANYPTDHNFQLFGISAMAFDAETNSLYVATAISTAIPVVNYAIEKLSYDASKIGSDNKNVLTRTGTLPFYNYGVDTKCISSLTIGTDPASSGE